MRLTGVLDAHRSHVVTDLAMRHVVTAQFTAINQNATVLLRQLKLHATRAQRVAV